MLIVIHIQETLRLYSTKYLLDNIFIKVMNQENDLLKNIFLILLFDTHIRILKRGLIWSRHI